MSWLILQVIGIACMTVSCKWLDAPVRSEKFKASFKFGCIGLSALFGSFIAAVLDAM